MTLPRERDWREVLMERYKRVGNPRMGPLQVKVSLPFLQLMDEAAKRMNANRSTFIRRAVAVQIAHVLQRDVHGILRYCPDPKPWGFDGFPGSEMDDGTNIEQWCPHPGCRGSHLR
jgi:hypothetical protein